MSSTVSIQRSSPDSDSCEESVVNQMTSGSSPVTVMDTLSCRYAGRRVTYCLQFRTDECQSNVVTETVRCKRHIYGREFASPPPTSNIFLLHGCPSKTSYLFNFFTAAGDKSIIIEIRESYGPLGPLPPRFLSTWAKHNRN